MRIGKHLTVSDDPAGYNKLRAYYDANAASLSEGERQEIVAALKKFRGLLRQVERKDSGTPPRRLKNVGGFPAVTGYSG